MEIHWTSFVAGAFCGFGLAVGLLAAVAVLGTRPKTPSPVPFRPNEHPDPHRGPDELYMDRQGKLDERKRPERSQWDD